MNHRTTFSDAIESVMLKNGYFAPLSLIYREFEKYRTKTGKTPDKTIQERVQRDPRFTRIGFGVYGLTEYLNRLPRVIEPQEKRQKQEYAHTRIQGMLLEMGEMRRFATYTNDKSKVFDGKKLGLIASLSSCPPFTFANIISQSVSYFDVIWFNVRGFPKFIFEVEDSTDFRSAFVKFNELQDFNTNFVVVAPDGRRKKFDTEAGKRAFEAVAPRCRFETYENIETKYQTALADANMSISF